MRSRVCFILALAFSVLLAACGSGGGGGKTTPTPASGAKTTTPPSSASTTPSAAQLEKGLLVVGDLGTGWKIGEPINPGDLASVGQAVPCLDPAVAKRLTAVTGIQFEPTDRSYKHMIELVTIGDPAQLNSDLQALVGAVDSCGASAAATGTEKATVTRFDLPPLGDQRAGFITRTQAGWYGRGAYVRVGPIAITFGLTEILGPQAKPQVSDQTFLHLLQTAVRKLSA